MAVIKTKDELKDVFIGVSELRFSTKSGAFTADTTWDYELPILRDSITFDNPAPTINNAYVHGKKTAWASTSEPSDMTLTFEIPSIHDDITGWLYNKAGDVSNVAEEVDGVAGAWSGQGISMEAKVIEGMAMIISEDKKHALLIKNLKGYSSMNMSSISTTPLSFTVTATLESGVTTDPDGDVVFLNWKANV